MASSLPVPTGVPRGLASAFGAAPLIALAAVAAPLAAIGVGLREVVFQGLDPHAVVRVAGEVGYAMILTNGLNREALFTVVVQCLLAFPFLATLAHLRAGVARPPSDAAGRSEPARGWDSRS
jgi:hypothetical protein